MSKDRPPYWQMLPPSPLILIIPDEHQDPIYAKNIYPAFRSSCGDRTTCIFADYPICSSRAAPVWKNLQLLLQGRTPYLHCRNYCHARGVPSNGQGRAPCRFRSWGVVGIVRFLTHAVLWAIDEVLGQLIALLSGDTSCQRYLYST